MTEQMNKSRWKPRLVRALQCLRPPYGGGTVNYKTTISVITLRLLRATVPFGVQDGLRGLGGAVTDTALQLFLALVSPDVQAAAEFGQRIGEVLAEHPIFVERLKDNLKTVADNLDTRADT